MITPQFIMAWFISSAIIFGLVFRLHKELFHDQMDRDLNGLCILFSQGLGAALAYAVYS